MSGMPAIYYDGSHRELKVWDGNIVSQAFLDAVAAVGTCLHQMVISVAYQIRW